MASKPKDQKEGHSQALSASMRWFDERRTELNLGKSKSQKPE